MTSIKRGAPETFNTHCKMSPLHGGCHIYIRRDWQMTIAGQVFGERHALWKSYTPSRVDTDTIYIPEALISNLVPVSGIIFIRYVPFH
jgi:hypothetical protein